MWNFKFLSHTLFSGHFPTLSPRVVRKKKKKTVMVTTLWQKWEFLKCYKRFLNYLGPRLSRFHDFHTSMIACRLYKILSPNPWLLNIDIMSNRTVQINNHAFITETEKAECVAVISRVVVKFKFILQKNLENIVRPKLCWLHATAGKKVP